MHGFCSGTTGFEPEFFDLRQGGGSEESVCWFTLGALLVYRLGTHIPLPGLNPEAYAQAFRGQAGGILGLFNMFAGGAVERMAIFALGIMPYISASIIVQLMTSVVPALEQLKKEGEAGPQDHQPVHPLRHGAARRHCRPMALRSALRAATASWSIRAGSSVFPPSSRCSAARCS
ncbi:preprotein translocase subunit SecY [Ensifer canadensis]